MYPNIIRLKDVIKRTALSRSTIYALMSKGQFPKQVQITERCIGWSEDTIHNWILKKLEIQQNKLGEKNDQNVR